MNTITPTRHAGKRTPHRLTPEELEAKGHEIARQCREAGICLLPVEQLDPKVRQFIGIAAPKNTTNTDPDEDKQEDINGGTAREEYLKQKYG